MGRVQNVQHTGHVLKTFTFNDDISKWYVSSVTDMHDMFAGASTLMTTSQSGTCPAWGTWRRCPCKLNCLCCTRRPWGMQYASDATCLKTSCCEERCNVKNFFCERREQQKDKGDSWARSVYLINHIYLLVLFVVASFIYLLFNWLIDNNNKYLT